MNIKNVGKQLKCFRKIKKLTQEQLSNKSSISLSYIKKIESTNNESPSTDTLISLAKALNIPVDFLLRECGEEFSNYTDYIMLRDLKIQDCAEKKIYSNAIFSLYSFFTSGE